MKICNKHGKFGIAYTGPWCPACYTVNALESHITQMGHKIDELERRTRKNETKTRRRITDKN